MGYANVAFLTLVIAIACPIAAIRVYRKGQVKKLIRPESYRLTG
jgi:hypothetical protein